MWRLIFLKFKCRFFSLSLSLMCWQKASSPVSLMVSLKMCLMFLFNDAQNQLWWLVFLLLTGVFTLPLFASISITPCLSLDIEGKYSVGIQQHLPCVYHPWNHNVAWCFFCLFWGCSLSEASIFNALSFKKEKKNNIAMRMCTQIYTKRVQSAKSLELLSIRAEFISTSKRDGDG